MQRRVPAEWEPHSATIVSWPTRDIVWSPVLPDAVNEYRELINIIANDEQVIVICRAEDAATVRDTTRDQVQTIIHPIDDGWIRDNGPLGVKAGDSLVAVDFKFNSWGGRFAPWDGDANVGVRIAEHFGAKHEDVSFVLEGGAISFDGHGSALVVEECVLNPNRNGGGVSRGQFESIVRTHLGIVNVIWLPFGLLEDLVNTDGHVDNVAVFGPDHQIIVQMSEQENPNYSRLAENLDVIRSSRCADGKEMTVETIDSLPYATMPNGKLQPAPYVNFALTGKTIVIPSVGASSDGQVGQLMMDIFPGRVARFVPSYALTYGGGGPHCITMQWPA